MLWVHQRCRLSCYCCCCCRQQSVYTMCCCGASNSEDDSPISMRAVGNVLESLTAFQQNIYAGNWRVSLHSLVALYRNIKHDLSVGWPRDNDVVRCRASCSGVLICLSVFAVTVSWLSCALLTSVIQVDTLASSQSENKKTKWVHCEVSQGYLRLEFRSSAVK